MIDGVTCHMLPHPSGVPHLHVNRPLLENGLLLNRAFSHDVTAAILVFQNNKTAAILTSQTSPVGVELLSYVKAFFSSNKFAQKLKNIFS